MSEIRFRSDELLEDKLTSLMDRLKLKEKKEVIVYLITKEYDSEGQKKNV